MVDVLQKDVHAERIIYPMVNTATLVENVSTYI